MKQLTSAGNLPVKHHETAGGVVIDGRGHVLTLTRTVERDGKPVHEIRLPKGHIDPGETPEDAALREVREESGYDGLRIVADLGEAESRFEFRGKYHIRRERYFLMVLTRGRRGDPAPVGAEEALFLPVWREPEAAVKEMSYPTEREFVRRAMDYLSCQTPDFSSSCGAVAAED